MFGNSVIGNYFILLEAFWSSDFLGFCSLSKHMWKHPLLLTFNNSLWQRNNLVSTEWEAIIISWERETCCSLHKALRAEISIWETHEDHLWIRLWLPVVVVRAGKIFDSKDFWIQTVLFSCERSCYWKNLAWKWTQPTVHLWWQRVSIMYAYIGSRWRSG